MHYHDVIIDLQTQVSSSFKANCAKRINCIRKMYIESIKTKSSRIVEQNGKTKKKFKFKLKTIQNYILFE